MKKYEIINQINGVVYGIYDDQEKAKKDYEAYLELTDDTKQSLVIVELPEVEEADIDLQKIDCILNSIIDNMEELSTLVDLDYISICRASNKSDSGFFIYASNGNKSGTTYVGDRTDIFSSIYKQMKGGNKNV